MILPAEIYMNAPSPVTDNHIRLTSNDVTPVIQLFDGLIPDLALAVIDLQGTVLAAACDLPPDLIDAVVRDFAPNNTEMREVSGSRVYPIYINDQLSGILIARGANSAYIEEAFLRFIAAYTTQRSGMSDQLQLLKAAQTRTKQLEVIMEITREMSSTLDLEKLLQLIMSSAVHILGAGSGSLFLVDEATGDLVFRVVTSGEEEIIGKRVPFGKGIVGQVASTGEPIICVDVDKDERFFGQLDHSGFVTRSLMAVPLRVPERLIGVVELINKVDGTDFDEDDGMLLITFAAQAAIAIENARLYQEAIQKHRLEQELQLAYKVQASLIPTKTPQLEGWDFAAWWQPAREVSGDYYDFILKDGRLSLVIADVSDKGMHAALFMALTRSVVRATALTSLSPAESLTQANRLICADSTGGMFVTLFYAEINPADHSITYVNCGHNPPLWYRASEQSITEVTRTTLMLGFDDKLKCQQRVIGIESGDVIVFYTDGVTEAFNANREQFGEDRLTSIIMAHAGESPQQILAAVHDELEAFTGATPQSDDVTIVVAKQL